jgi:type IV secretory pathway TraG/TraD family ATPase VirD4
LLLAPHNTTSKNNYGDDVWPKSEVNLLTIFMAHVAANGGHLGQIRAMMREGPDKLVSVMEQSPVPSVRDEYRGFSNNSREGFRYGVFAGLMQRLALWVNPRIVALTEKTDIDIDVLVERLFTFYLAVPAQKTHLKPVAALMFNFILEIALEKQFQHPLYLSLDEFTNFGMIPRLADKLSIIRHRDIAVMLGFQDFSQLERVYGREETTSIRSQMKTQIYFRPNMLESAKRISEHAGRTTESDRKISSSGQIVEREMGRDLIDPSEVLNLPEDKILVFTPKTSPMLMERFS